MKILNWQIFLEGLVGKPDKRYNDFSINESFATSNDYQDFLTYKATSIDVLNDSLFDVKEFASARTYRYLVDTKGHAVNTEVDDNEKYRVLYSCLIQYNIKFGKNDFNKVIDNLNTINISINEMISRAESKGLKVKDNSYIIKSFDERINHEFLITFLSDEINTKELKDIYNKYISMQDKEYLEGIKKLRDIYRNEGIEFDKYMDTNDEDELILVGVFINEDVYGIALYNKETKQFSIDTDEIANSIEAYNEL